MQIRVAMLLACFIFPAMSSASGFSMTDTQGRIHTLEGYKGRWVLVNLWATWCGPCLAEMPELQALSKSRKDIVVLGLAVDGQNPRRVTQFAERLKVTYPIIAGTEKLAQLFKPRGFPTSILYDASGGQVFFKEGPITRLEVEAILD